MVSQSFFRFINKIYVVTLLSSMISQETSTKSNYLCFFVQTLGLISHGWNIKKSFLEILRLSMLRWYKIYDNGNHIQPVESHYYAVYSGKICQIFWEIFIFFYFIVMIYFKVLVWNQGQKFWFHPIFFNPLEFEPPQFWPS